MINANFVKYENSKSDEYIRLDTTIIGIDNLIAKASTAEEANALFKAKDVIYSQKRHSTYRQPVNDNWISVEDKLPDKSQKVLAFYKALGEQNRIHNDLIATNWRKSNGDFIPTAGYKVTHWMPLPKPPKGE